MIYKMHNFFREWKGYDKIYSILKNNYTVLNMITLVIAALSFILFIFRSSIAISLLRGVVSMSLAVIQYFSGNIEYEKGKRFFSFMSRLLMFAWLFIFIINLLHLISYAF